MNMTNTADIRGLILGFLYEHGFNGAVVRPDSFSPPMNPKDIFDVGVYFHQDNIIKEFPADTNYGYFMQITLRGQAIWEGKQEPTLDITIPPQ
jgi:hypothetical protein